MLGVVKEVPVPDEEPPVLDEYQLSVPELAVAPKITVPASHLLPGVVVATAGIVFIVAATAVLAEVHPLFVAST
jgi:hypothetical protein